ncbi:MAG TPA: PAS domain-containing protein [Bryobacteraceae bacterium]|nr:PAS domain-containing protein [Bryobacteraceae bacterium]
MAEGEKFSRKIDRELGTLRGRIAELEAELRTARNGAGANSPARMGFPAGLAALDLLEKVEEGLAILDTEWRFTYNNRTAEYLLRQAPGDLLGKCLWDIFPQLLGTPTEQALRRSMENRQGETTELYFTPLSSWFQGRINPVPGGGVFIFFRNITERKTAEAALQRSEEKWRSLANAIPQFVWIARSLGDVHFINDYFYEYTGLPKGALDPRIWSQALHPEDLPRIAEMWKEATASGSERMFEYRVRRESDGTWRWHRGFHRPERDSSGRIVRWIGSGFEIHDLKLAQEALRRTE